MSRKMLLCLLLLTTAGCSTTTDPRQGGLFGYNPTAYEHRLDERRQMLDALERNKQQSQEEAQQLQNETEEKRNVLDRQKETLSGMTLI
jgi:hypothetical protein